MRAPRYSFTRKEVRPMALRFSSFVASVYSAFGLRNRAAVGLGLASLLLAGGAAAQTPVLLPNTISSIAGTGATTPLFTVGAPCPANPQFTATDLTARLSGDERSGPHCDLHMVDPLGNIYISANSANPQIIRKIDARTGIITAFAGADASQCASGYGHEDRRHQGCADGQDRRNCPVSYTGGFNGPVTLGMDPYGNLLMGIDRRQLGRSYLQRCFSRLLVHAGQ